MNPVFLVLSKARALIVDPACWTQNARARTADGLPTSDSDPASTCICSSSALWRASDVSTKEGAQIASKARKALQKAMHGDIFDYNDENEHRDILRAFDRAMARVGEH